MTYLLLQFLGGMFYLLNKLFFAWGERAENHKGRQKWRAAAWMVYLLGIPPWVFIFLSERNWIAASVEISGVPAMLIGLVAAFQKPRQVRISPWLDYLAKMMIIIGLGVSLRDFGGLTTFNQAMELGVASGFLLGTYFLAQRKALGYIWLMIGNVCAASLMMRQGYYVLMGQQILSLFLVYDAYRTQKQRRAETR